MELNWNFQKGVGEGEGGKIGSTRKPFEGLIL